jgi:hypothetical protein
MEVGAVRHNFEMGLPKDYPSQLRQIPTSCLPTLLIFIHIEHICSFFVAFYSATIDGRNLIFGHQLHIGTPYRGKRFVNRNQLSRQTGSRNLTGPKTLPTTWHTYMKLVTKYQIFAINSCWEKCDEKCAYMFNGEAFLDPSDSYFLFADFVDFYTHWTYMLIFRRIFLSNNWCQISDILSQASYRYPILWETFLTVYPPPPSGSGGIKTVIGKSNSVKQTE